MNTRLCVDVVGFGADEEADGAACDDEDDDEPHPSPPELWWLL
jgi:hypothetical protein